MKQNLETVLTFSQLTHKSRAYLWRPCDVWMHYLMFNLGDASVPSDIWLLLITAEIILQPYRNRIQLRFCMVAQTHSLDLDASTRREGLLWNGSCRAVPRRRLALVPQKMWLRNALWLFSALRCPADSKLGGFVGL